MSHCAHCAVCGSGDQVVVDGGGGGDGIVTDGGGGGSERRDVSRLDNRGEQTGHDGMDETLAPVQGLTTRHDNLKQTGSIAPIHNTKCNAKKKRICKVLHLT